MNDTLTKKIPTRKCTGCAGHFPKNALVRILRTPSGEILIDENGKMSGRGAYICKSASCLKKARKAGRIERSLDCRIPDEIYEKLEQELTGI